MKSIGLVEYNKKQSEKNLIPAGTRFGKLVVIEPIGYREHVPGHKRMWYKCQCDCGRTKEAMGNMLNNGQVGSCGECNYRSKGEYIIASILKENNISFIYDSVNLELEKEFGRKLRFDFTILNNENEPIRFIEYDGRQHFLGPDTNYWGHSKDI